MLERFVVYYVVKSERIKRFRQSTCYVDNSIPLADAFTGSDSYMMLPLTYAEAAHV
jgi:hypothetical protein